MYQDALLRAEEVMRHSVAPDTEQRRIKAGQLFSTWLAQLPDKHIENAAPEDVLCYLESEWVHKHGRSYLPGHDATVASPAGVDQVISHLSSLFTRLGRVGEYDSRSTVGNPCHSVLIRDYLRGYSRKMCASGYEEFSAVPLSFEKRTALLASLNMTAFQHDGVPRLAYLRDASHLMVLWDSGYRGGDYGKLQLADLFHTDGNAVFPSGYNPTVAMPFTLVIRPGHGTKTNKRSRAHQQPVTLKRHTDPDQCAIRQLWVYLQCAHHDGHPIKGYLFRPTLANQKGFKEAPWSTTCFIHRLQSHLQRLGWFSGETSHSIRRGTLQHTATLHGTAAAQAQGQIKTASVLQIYLDPYRHQGRLSAQAGVSKP